MESDCMLVLSAEFDEVAEILEFSHRLVLLLQCAD